MAQPPNASPVSRLAPSPTGALHLGNLRTFLINWALARQNDWRLLMRVEDLDGPRVKDGAAERALDLLAWIGLDYDGPVQIQTEELAPCREALEKLVDAGLAYPCTCTRREIENAQSAPHEEDHELRYPGTCRPADADTATIAPPLDHEQTDQAWRLKVPPGPVTFTDEIAGPQSFDIQSEVGDFVIATKRGLPSYQLAVTVDDARSGVTDVVRGDDLLSSTARQLVLYDCLDLTPPIRWWHLPLVLGPDGRRLAKRHGDTRVATYREHDVPAERIVGLLADWSGIPGPRRAMPADEFCEAFALDRLPRQPITFTEDDDAWLRDHH